MAVLFAGLHPERTRALILSMARPVTCDARTTPSACRTPARSIRRSRLRTAICRPVGSEPSGRPDLPAWWRASGGLPRRPSQRALPAGSQWDVRPALSAISAPTLVLHHADNRYIRTDNGQYLAEHIPGARYIELAGADSLFYAGDQDALLGEIETFLTGRAAHPNTTACSRRSCSPMSSPRHSGLQSSAMRGGVSSSTRTTGSPPTKSADFAGGSSRTPATASSPRSTDRPERFGAPRASVSGALPRHRHQGRPSRR